MDLREQLKGRDGASSDRRYHRFRADPPSDCQNGRLSRRRPRIILGQAETSLSSQRRPLNYPLAVKHQTLAGGVSSVMQRELREFGQETFFLLLARRSP